MAENTAVGKRVPRVDGIALVTGSAKYTADLSLPGMLHGRILRSPHPHAKILNIDTSKAKALRGVKAVITGKDTAGIKFGIIPFPPFEDDLGLAINKVRFIGDEVAAVAAISEDIAEEALDLIDIEYEVLPAVFDPEEALKEGAPIIHDDEDRESPFRGTNIANISSFNFGNIEEGFKEADYIFEDEFTTNNQHQMYMEPHAALAEWDNSGKLTLWSTTQTPFMLRRDLAKVLNMPENRIRVIKPRLGGGFGGKHEMLSLDFCACLLSQKTGKPVKIVYSREEDMISSRGRHPFKIKLRTGIKKDGLVVAKDCTCFVNNGAYCSHGPAIMAAGGGMGIVGVFNYRNVRFHGTLVYTNTVAGGAYRGFGSLQVHFADDVHMENIARELGIDAVELRLRNAVHSGDHLANGEIITSCGLSDCIKITAENLKLGEGNLGPGEGIGQACNTYVSGGKIFFPHDSSSAFVKVNEGGTLTVYTGASDIGQGLDTTMCQIAAEVFKIPTEKVSIVTADTELTPMDLGSFASRATFMAGNAVLAAARDAQKQVLEFVAEKLEANVDDMEMENERIVVKGTEIGMSLSDATTAALVSPKGISFLGRGYYNPPTELIDYQTGIGNISPAYTFGAQAAKVFVDSETGEVKLKEIDGACDVGVAINPMSVEGQMEGCVCHGLGMAVSENLYKENGLVLNPSILEYKMPTAMDMPSMTTTIVEPIDPEGPFGAKGFSEGCQVPTCPAIANAICNACGVKLRDLPMTPEKVLHGLKLR